MLGKAFVFLNPMQAARFGHVGWGFALDESDRPNCYFGSTDHLCRHGVLNLAGWMRYAHVKPSGHIDWWAEAGVADRMIDTMSGGHHLRYHLMKEIVVPDASPERAREAAQAVAANGWSLLANNCVHHTYTVLTRYGAKLPPPMESPFNIIPRRWFAEIDAKVMNIKS